LAYSGDTSVQDLSFSQLSVMLQTKRNTWHRQHIHSDIVWSDFLSPEVHPLPHQSLYWLTVLSHLLSSSSVCLACVTVDVSFEHSSCCMATHISAHSWRLLHSCSHANITTATTIFLQ